MTLFYIFYELHKVREEKKKPSLENFQFAMGRFCRKIQTKEKVVFVIFLPRLRCLTAAKR